jgi:hypothetical protein
MRVAQACLRVSDLWFTFRTRAVESVSDEVVDFLTERHFSFEHGAKLAGRSGRGGAGRSISTFARRPAVRWSTF